MNPPTGFTIAHLGDDAFTNRVPFTIVTFFTTGDRGRHYEQEVERLRESLVRVGYESRFVALDAGERLDWRACCMLKPVVIEWALHHQATDVLWLDADAVVHGKIPLFEQWPDGDLGVRIYPGNPAHLFGATLYFRSCLESLELAAQWAHVATFAAQRLGPCHDAFNDQDALAYAIRQLGASLRPLPAELAFIFDKDRQGKLCASPLIEHMQASRTKRDNARMVKNEVSRIPWDAIAPHVTLCE